MNEKHYKDTTNYDAFVYTEPGTQIPKKLINYRKNLQKNGFDINSEEGITYIMQDRNFIAKHFYPYLSQTMKKYQIKLNIENAEGFVSDASIIISPQNLVERIIWYEKFIYENPTFIFIENCRTTLKTYQTILFTGIDNTPVFSFNAPDKITDYYHETYEYLHSPNHPTLLLAYTNQLPNLEMKFQLLYVITSYSIHYTKLYEPRPLSHIISLAHR